MNVIQIIVALLVGGVVGLLVGRNNPSLAAAAAKYVATAQAEFEDAVAKAKAKLRK